MQNFEAIVDVSVVKPTQEKFSFVVKKEYPAGDKDDNIEDFRDLVENEIQEENKKRFGNKSSVVVTNVTISVDGEYLDSDEFSAGYDSVSQKTVAEV